MSIIDFVFPPKCKICNIRIKRGAVCPVCFDKIKKSINPIWQTLQTEGVTVNARCLFSYENSTVKDLIFALKRQANRELFEFASELYSSLIEDVRQELCVVNVPRSRKNIKKYGYDHVGKPCRIMCKGKDNLVYAPVLKRRAASNEQKNLTAAERKINVRGKFRAVKKDIPKNILLVDDVITTSSTVCECAKELKKVYPNANISCISLAHTDISSDLARK